MSMFSFESRIIVITVIRHIANNLLNECLTRFYNLILLAVTGKYNKTLVIIFRSIIENKNKFKNTIFLILLAIQAIHIFWITDDIVYSTFIGGNIIEIPQYLAWFAILIDYLELPIVYDLLKRIIKNEQK